MDQDLYDKAARMILSSSTREELKTAQNFIMLIEKSMTEEQANRDAIANLRKMWLEKDNKIFQNSL
jgi:hypothetical protein